MSYAIVISAEAAAQMQSLAAPLPAFISAQLDRLRDNPSALSKPTTLLQAHVEDIAVEFG